jgi:hypothetical protein
MVNSTKRACNTDPDLKETFTSRMLDFSEDKLLMEFKVRGAGKVEKWIPRVKDVK